MDERILKWVFDIKIAIDEIDNFFDDEETLKSLVKQ